MIHCVQIRDRVGLLNYLIDVDYNVPKKPPKNVFFIFNKQHEGISKKHPNIFYEELLLII